MTDRSQDPQPAGTDLEPQKTSRKKGVRCRTGCWNCRRKRRKCNGKRPTCETCSQKGEVCQWGIRLSFRPENSYSMPETHPSMRRASALSRDTAIQFYDITREIIRDYQVECHSQEGTQNTSEQGTNRREESCIPGPASTGQPPIPYEHRKSTSTFAYSPEMRVLSRPSYTNSVTTATPLNQPDSESPGSMDSTESMNMLRSAAAQLLDLGCAPPPIDPGIAGRGRDSIGGDGDHFLQPQAGTSTATTTPATARLSEPSHYDDGIFLPGSTYLELHSTLRDHIFDTARSAQPSRAPSPGIAIGADDTIDGFAGVNYEGPSISPETPPSPPTSTPLFAELEWQDEYKLWKNWVDEIAPWLDKFDNDCHFGRTLPVMARNHRHLRCSMLALSARQQERKNPERRSSASLALYQEAVHQLIPQLQTRSTAVVASCVVLCVLEMMSCSPKMWRRHLDGCASLIQSVGINGFSAGLEKALFWCFARMDVCGGLISSQHTLIPINSWSPAISLEDDIQLYRAASSCFSLYANYAVYLCALVLDLFAGKHIEAVHTRRWSELFNYIEDWYTQRPPEMLPILELNAPKGDYSCPFPVVLFSNPAAVSGNQLYHTAALLMLQEKPRSATIVRSNKPRSILWHARRICAISISNEQHGCWTNSIQPLWIAGKVMSHPSEHQAILDIYARIEKDTGWGAKWRADDLKNYWGDLDG